MTGEWIDKVQPSTKKPRRRPSVEAEAPAAEVAAPVLRKSVETAVELMTWLKDTDRAVVDIALVYADRIDAALATESGPNVTKALYLGPHLLNALRALGGAPAERKALGGEEAVGGKLAQLRSISKTAKTA